MSTYDTTTEVDEFTADALQQLAREAEITGRSSMTKDELYGELEEQQSQLLTPFSAAFEVEEGDEVSMNHLKSALTVQEVREKDSYLGVIMVTSRGGRHCLIVPKDGAEVGKNGSSPHLRRWRAGDQEWMNNSTDPVFIRRLENAEDSDDE